MFIISNFRYASRILRTQRASVQTKIEQKKKEKSPTQTPVPKPVREDFSFKTRQPIDGSPSIHQTHTGSGPFIPSNKFPPVVSS